MELISSKLLIKYSPITEDTGTTSFVPYVKIAQILHINKLLGEPLIAELSEQIKDGTLTPKNKALLEVMAPCIAYYTVYQGLPFHWASIVNKGVTVRESENSKGVDQNDIAQLRAWLLNDANTFKQNLIEYLCKCASSYPLWNPAGHCGGCGKKQIDASDLGINF